MKKIKITRVMQAETISDTYSKPLDGNWGENLQFTIILLIITIFVPQNSFADLEYYRQKNVDRSITQDNLNDLSKYDHFIRYFSYFEYFIVGHRVSPDFIRALIIAESDANPHAESGMKAIGLGQILITTGKEAGKELAAYNYDFKYVSRQKLLNLSKQDLFDPAVNIILTCYLVSKYNYKFSGDMELVVSAKCGT